MQQSPLVLSVCHYWHSIQSGHTFRDDGAILWNVKLQLNTHTRRTAREDLIAFTCSEKLEILFKKETRGKTCARKMWQDVSLRGG
jgi:hypothetical protein